MRRQDLHSEILAPAETADGAPASARTSEIIRLDIVDEEKAMRVADIGHDANAAQARRSADLHSIARVVERLGERNLIPGEAGRAISTVTLLSA